MIVNPPLYVVSGSAICWKCKNEVSAICLIAPIVEDEIGEVCVISYVEAVPQFVLQFVQSRCPTFRRKFSQTAETAYYGNICTKCDALQGDHYLHEPGGPFFPTSEIEAACLEITEVPLPGSVEIDGSPAYGLGEIILQHARRIEIER
jgi:hypothetical protein